MDPVLVTTVTLLKAKVAQDLSDATGVTPQEASGFVEQWAHSSNDNDMRSLAIQQDAAEEFGLKLSEFTQQRIKDNQRGAELADELKGAAFNPLMESDKQRTILRAMYNETQAELRARGIEEVRLYRGVKLDTELGSIGDIVSIETNPVESWSASQKIGRDFGIMTTGSPYGVVLEAVVPANRILSTPATGFGCLLEGEVTVLGGVSGDMATIVEAR